MPAIVFDLDETLLDTSMLREDRKARRWRELAARLDEVEAYSDADSRLQAAGLPAQVKEMGYEVGVLTQSPRWYAERLLDAFEIPFDALITGSDGYAPKPDPSSLLAIAGEFDVPIEDCVMVGDDVADIRAAQSAGALGIGVAWSRRAPAAWRRHWPHMAVARPDRVIDALVNRGPRLPFAEASLAGHIPLWHWGSLLRLGNQTFGAGHYYGTSDSRHPDHALSRLIIEAKEGPQASEHVGELLAGLFDTPWSGTAVDLITSVPPKPGQDYDRFASVRAALAGASGARERGDVLRQVFDDDGYRHQQADERLERVVGRFNSSTLENERVLLIDDVITSGGQAEECRSQLLAAGARSVVILALGVTQDRLSRSCPQCGGFLRLITSGPYGPFIGCSNYHRGGCRYTEDAPSI